MWLLVEKCSGVNIKKTGNLLECLECQVSFTAFDRAEVCAVNAHLLRKRFLAEAQSLAVAAQIAPDSPLEVAFHSGNDAAVSLLEGLQTYK